MNLQHAKTFIISSPFIASITILLTEFLVAIATGALLAYTPLRGVELGFSVNEIGYILSLYNLGMLLCCLFAGHLVRRVGQIRSMAIYANILCVTSLLLIFLDDLASWMLIRLLQGFSLNALFIICMSWLNEVTPSHFRARISALLFINHTVAILIAAFLVNDYYMFHQELLIFVAFFSALGLLPIAFTKVEQPIVPENVTVDFINVFRVSSSSMIIAFLVGFIAVGFFNSIQLYGLELGFPISQVTNLSIAYLVGNLLFQYPFAYLSEKYDRRLIMIITLGIASVPMLLLFGFDHLLPFLLIGALIMIFGGMMESSYTIANAHGFDYAQPGSYLIVANTLFVTWGIGAFIGPLFITQTLSFLGASSLTLILLLLIVIAIPFMVWRRNVRGVIEVGDNELADAMVMVSAPTQATQNLYVEAVYQEELYEENSDESPEEEQYPDDDVYVDAIEALQEKQQDI